MKWMGGATPFMPSAELRTKIIDLYKSGCSIHNTYLTLVELGIMLTESNVGMVLKSEGITRNSRQLKGARIKSVFRRVKQCEHCGEEFKQAFARHVFCDVCAPDGKFSKYIRKYGISKREFDVMFAEQQGHCAICQKRLDLAKDTHIDHDHVTGAVRGLLCNVCNTRVGVFESFADVARAYLAGCKDYRPRGRT